MGIASPEDYALCRRIMQAASKNYTFASALLPPDKRSQVEALYALMRVGDDRVDVSHAGYRSSLEAIDEWERQYWRAFEQGDSPQPVLRAYLDTAIRCLIPKETMAAYFRAMKDDLTVTRYPTFRNLLYYMEGSAIPVARAMVRILGVRAPFSVDDALPAADSLAIAMQLSNFWRDIGQDWGINRIYVPQEDMERFRYREEDLSARRITRDFVDLLEFEFRRTESYYAQARQGVRLLATGRWSVMSGLQIYRAILEGIRRNGYDVFTRRAGAGLFRKVGLAFKSLWQVARP